MQPLGDLMVCEGDIAQLEVKFSQENIEGTWMKNDQVLSASDSVHMVIDKLVHKLLLENVTRDDAAVYSFVVPAQDISSSGKLSVQSKDYKCTKLHHILSIIQSFCLIIFMLTNIIAPGPSCYMILLIC